MANFVSRAGEKLDHALKTFEISVDGSVCADFGSNVGGFVDCLLQHGVVKVYAVETGYGVLDWNLRNDPRVVVLERQNAMHITLPEKVDFISVDVSWTRLHLVMPNVLANLRPGGKIVVLVKPHYEAQKNQLRGGKLLEEYLPETLEKVRQNLRELGLEVKQETKSPIVGNKGGNEEYLFEIGLK